MEAELRVGTKYMKITRLKNTALFQFFERSPFGRAMANSSDRNVPYALVVPLIEMAEHWLIAFLEMSFRCWLN